jgi:hypothetical protein
MPINGQRRCIDLNWPAANQWSEALHTHLASFQSTVTAEAQHSHLVCCQSTVTAEAQQSLLACCQSMVRDAALTSFGLLLNNGQRCSTDFTWPAANQWSEALHWLRLACCQSMVRVAALTLGLLRIKVQHWLHLACCQSIVRGAAHTLGLLPINSQRRSTHTWPAAN